MWLIQVSPLTFPLVMPLEYKDHEHGKFLLFFLFFFKCLKHQQEDKGHLKISIEQRDKFKII